MFYKLFSSFQFELAMPYILPSWRLGIFFLKKYPSTLLKSVLITNAKCGKTYRYLQINKTDSVLLKPGFSPPLHQAAIFSRTGLKPR